jgi:hypothetical protein
MVIRSSWHARMRTGTSANGTEGSNPALLVSDEGRAINSLDVSLGCIVSGTRLDEFIDCRFAQITITVDFDPAQGLFPVREGVPEHPLELRGP